MEKGHKINRVDFSITWWWLWSRGKCFNSWHRGEGSGWNPTKGGFPPCPVCATLLYSALQCFYNWHARHKRDFSAFHHRWQCTTTVSMGCVQHPLSQSSMPPLPLITWVAGAATPCGKSSQPTSCDNTKTKSRPKLNLQQKPTLNQNLIADQTMDVAFKENGNSNCILILLLSQKTHKWT